MDPERVVYLSSFSKILAPGLRTAFLIGPEEILAKVEIAKQSANLCGSGLDQRVILACLKRGLIEAQKERIRPYYRAKRDAMLQALAAEMPDGVRWTRPAGGLFVWLTLPEGMDAEALIEAAVAEGVAYVAGGPFHVDGGGANTMRLTFAKEDAPTIAEGRARASPRRRRAWSGLGTRSRGDARAPRSRRRAPVVTGSESATATAQELRPRRRCG